MCMSTVTEHKGGLMLWSGLSCETRRAHHQAVDASWDARRVEPALDPCDLWEMGGRGRQDSCRICQYSACEPWQRTLVGPKSLVHDEF